MRHKLNTGLVDSRYAQISQELQHYKHVMILWNIMFCYKLSQ